MTIGDGGEIKIKFTQPLIGDVDGLQTPVAYKQVKVSTKGATHSAQNVYSSSYPASNAFDGNNSTYWYGTSSTNWIKTKFKEPKNITGLRLYMGSYYIKTFTISGSNDD